MTITTTPIAGLLVLNPQVWRDERGYFCETFHLRKYKKLTGQNPEFVQDNQARSARGVLRGMHFQTGDSAQAKLVRCIEGAVFDVAVDFRPESETYLQWFGIELTADNFTQLLVPRGFAHGYLVLSEWATFAYKCDNFYDPESEGGLRYDDPAIGIEWPEVTGGYTLSGKDEGWPLLAQPF